MKQLWFTSLLVLAACTPIDTFVVDVPDGGDVTLPSGTSCARNDDCMAGQYCEKASCGAALGTCASRPNASFCPSSGPPLCGCDGVTYWNDCLRQSAGVEAVREQGPCRMRTQACDTSTPCPNDGYCARLAFPQDCGRLIAGTCWVLPDGACTGPGPTYTSCANLACFDACGAIRSQQPMGERPRGSGPCP